MFSISRYEEKKKYEEKIRESKLAQRGCSRFTDLLNNKLFILSFAGDSVFSFTKASVR